MSRWNIWRVLGACVAYVLVSVAATVWLGARNAREAAAAYQRAKGLGPNDDFLVTVAMPQWNVWIVVIPPIVFIAYWLITRSKS